ncbi:hypothetical protein VT84_08780 [Gemmata sp. SH-PL17]|uniref:hypothetical protein n=1 Tax=Gemmata sp. SH-PL17 TaxID=1630693 RepID=UPI0004B40347|nr:hypothetical protein [Gemmata sp. SH-PL17]AMV24478.1 hypothetical protein VT84_08780 [Gemmata sp. SH-PL17]
MPPPPPLKDVLEALYHAVLPGAGAAALVLGAFLAVGRWRAAALGSAVAVVVAFMCGNFAPPKLSIEDPAPTWENTYRVLLWKPLETSPCEQWLPRVSLVLVAVGLLTRWLGLAVSRAVPERAWWTANLLVWLPRIAAVYYVSAWLLLGNAAADPKWASLRWELIASMVFVWLVLDSLARGGASAEISLYLTAVFYAGAGVLLYSHNAKFMELAVIIGSAMFGIAVVTLVVPAREDGTRAIASGAIPAAVAFLPGLFLGTRPSHNETKVPALSFWLVALAPLILSPFLVPRVSRQNRWLLLALRAALILVPILIAVLLAGQHEKLPYEEEAEW